MFSEISRLTDRTNSWRTELMEGKKCREQREEWRRRRGQERFGDDESLTPLTKSDIMRPVRITAIGILQPTQESPSSLGVVLGSVDVVVFVQDIGGIDDDRSPELRLNNAPILDDYILGVGDCK